MGPREIRSSRAPSWRQSIGPKHIRVLELGSLRALFPTKNPHQELIKFWFSTAAPRCHVSSHHTNIARTLLTLANISSSCCCYGAATRKETSTIFFGSSHHHACGGFLFSLPAGGIRSVLCLPVASPSSSSIAASIPVLLFDAKDIWLPVTKACGHCATTCQEGAQTSSNAICLLFCLVWFHCSAAAIISQVAPGGL